MVGAEVGDIKEVQKSPNSMLVIIMFSFLGGTDAIKSLNQQL